ncbi:acetate--CoA ligase family protein [Paracoccus sp. (in: a-proteobacteria)]|uniref:acetate--CoA ligase family protein n=1 Tax=Paracoccus sp. TaxID=267 RepID=UPI002B000119|nr:acetate--CoA ligase family protein [Paracoccus sp. (in: a-proteobacteria)]
MNMAISALLRPRRLAIVGASPKEDSFGANLLQSIRYLGFAGEVVLVNPRYDRIGDMVCHGSLSEVPGEVDCAAFAVGDAHLASSLTAAAKAGLRGAVLFGRAHGDEGARSRIDVIRDIASNSGMAVCGANCMGFVNLVDGLQLTGMPFKSLPAPSGVALISHSGSTWSGLVGNRRQMGFDYAISAGLELATGAADYIRFLVEATDVRVIACVLETIRDPAGFLVAAQLAAVKGVPIIVLKLGRSEAAKHFAISHSGALSGSNAAYDAFFERHGIVQVRSLDELLDTAELLALRRVMPVPGIALGTDSGGERQLIVDLAADLALPFTELAPATMDAVGAHLDAGMEVSNPLDYWGDGADVMAPVLGAMAKDPGVGIVVMATNLPPDRRFSEMSAAAIRRVHAETDKPVAVMGNIATTLSPDIAVDLRGQGIAVLMGTASGLAALGHLRRWRFGQPAADQPPPLRLSPAAHAILDGAGGDMLRSAEGFRLLAEAGIPSAPFAEIRAPEDIAAFAAQHGWPVVLKIDDAAIAHKSDQGGVFLGLRNQQEATVAWQALSARHPQAPVIVQAMASGVELILGMTTNPDFGPLITLGLGGVFTEIFRDTTAVLPPVSAAEARRALERLKAFPLLTGARGRPPADLDALCTLISRFSAFAAGAAGRVAEIEINPVLAGPEGAVAVDCLALCRKEASHEQ